MTKHVKEFTIENWVSGDASEQTFRISVSPADSFDSEEPVSLPEAQSKLQKLEKQYFEILEQNRSLEEQLYNCQCQIRALQVSNVYTNDLHMNHDPEDLENKDKSSEGLKKQNFLQKRIIDDLMCKLQNMHNRFEYFKDDVTVLKSQFEKQRVSAEIEKQSKTVTFEQYQESLQTIAQLNNEIEKLKRMAQRRPTLKYVETRVIVEKSNYQIDNENSLLEQKFNQQVEQLKNKYSAQLLMTQQKHSVTVESLAIQMKKRIEDLKNFYEYRILSMIQDFSFEEGKFASKIILLSNQISENISQITELENRLHVYEEKFKFGQENQKQARSVIRNLQGLLDSISLEKSTQGARNKFEVEALMQKMEELQEDSRQNFEFQLKIAEKDHAETVAMLKKMYEHKIEKIDLEFKENEKKMLAKERTEAMILIAEITRLEKEKTHIEITTESRIQDVVREAKARYVEYEHLIDFSKKQLLEQWNLDKMQMKEDHEKEVKDLKEIFTRTLADRQNTLTAYYEDKIHQLEASSAIKIKNINKKFSEDLITLKEKHDNETICLNSQMEILRNELTIVKNIVDDLDKEKSDLIEKYGVLLEDEKIKYNDLSNKYELILSNKLKIQNDYEEKLANVHRTINDREKVLKIKFETEKNVIVNHLLSDKYELEASFQKKINEYQKKVEELNEKYAKAKEKKTVIRINDSGTQRIAKEIVEKDKIINQLIKEKNNLQTSLDYMNSTMRIFSTQEKTFHTKSSSSDSRTPKATIKNIRYGRV